MKDTCQLRIGQIKLEKENDASSREKEYSGYFGVIPNDNLAIINQSLCISKNFRDKNHMKHTVTKALIDFTSYDDNLFHLL